MELVVEFVADAMLGGKDGVSVHGFENADGLTTAVEGGRHRRSHARQVCQPEQTLADALGLTVEDFSRQVVKNGRMIGNRAVRHGQRIGIVDVREQLQAGRPAASQPVHLSHLIDASGPRCRGGELLDDKGLILRKEQLSGIQNGEKAVGAQTRKIARRPGAAGNDDVDLVGSFGYGDAQQLAELCRGERFLAVVDHQDVRGAYPGVESSEEVAEKGPKSGGLPRAARW